METYSAETARIELRTVLDKALAGETTVIERYNKPIAVVLGYDQWLKRELEAARREPRVSSEEVKEMLLAAGVDLSQAPQAAA